LLWRGTAESVVDLDPGGSSTRSTAYDTAGFQQVGAVSFGGPFHAALWSGTPESFVDLNPPGATSSWAYSVANGQQAGEAAFSGNGHAVVWHGTAESFVDLNPGPGWGSQLFGTNGSQQVGFAVTAGFGRRAAVWSGTPESYLDLHQFLPPQFQGEGRHSEAMGIDEFGNIVGWARELGPNGGHRAVMWVVPEPGTIGAFAAGLFALAIRRRRKT
ncbi:MAG: PEP-CTERM sorting domain-containing protein, partial [Fimbriimonadales bacterium]|nr:PEP-CTERM sorting domain-containing protein [Fimbriimonadales bacterium]